MSLLNVILIVLIISLVGYLCIRLEFYSQYKRDVIKRNRRGKSSGSLSDFNCDLSDSCEDNNCGSGSGDGGGE